MLKIIKTPLTKDVVLNLKAGERVIIEGDIYTARDEAHRLMYEMIQNRLELPFDIKNQIIYYVGPCPAKDNQVIGSAGPTTSSRMDKYTPLLLEKGLAGMIGKGLRSNEVISAMIEHKAVYFGAYGGLGALLSKKIIKSELIAFEELGTEAIRRLTVKDFPAVVLVDCYGNDIYKTGRDVYDITRQKNVSTSIGGEH